MLPTSFLSFFLSFLALCHAVPFKHVNLTTNGTDFQHPGLLHTKADFDRIADRVSKGAEPWTTGFEKLTNNSHAQLSWQSRPTEVVYRGVNPEGPQNYPVLYRDAAAAYALGIRWKVTGDPSYAEKAVEILDAWSETLKSIHGNADRFLAAGLYGYQLANAGEIMRTYEGWPSANFDRFVTMLTTVFYPMNHHFLVNHNGAHIDNYWANWDLCNTASILSIGILSDNKTMFEEAISYFLTGAGNGAIRNAIWYVHNETSGASLGQVQESGRDQGHNMMSLGLLATFAQIAKNQGKDLFGYLDNRILAGAEYVAKYNLGEDVPYEPYWTRSHGWNWVIGEGGRGQTRPIWEMIYHHYHGLKGLDAPYTKRMIERVRESSGGAEGGGGDYGSGSGGYDSLGYGTLLYSLD